MSSLVMCENPALFCMMAGILGKKYQGLQSNLLRRRKSLIQRTLPSFLGTRKVGKAHSLQGILWRTFSLTKCCNSALNTS